MAEKETLGAIAFRQFQRELQQAKWRHWKRIQRLKAGVQKRRDMLENSPLTREKLDILRGLAGFVCGGCGRHEERAGKLVAAPRNPRRPFDSKNVWVICTRCFNGGLKFKKSKIAVAPRGTSMDNFHA